MAGRRTHAGARSRRARACARTPERAPQLGHPVQRLPARRHEAVAQLPHARLGGEHLRKPCTQRPSVRRLLQVGAEVHRVKCQPPVASSACCCGAYGCHMHVLSLSSYLASSHVHCVRTMGGSVSRNVSYSKSLRLHIPYMSVASSRTWPAFQPKNTPACTHVAW